MRLQSISVLFAAAVGGMLLAGPAATAPDRTLGVSLMSAVVTSGGTLTAGSGVVSVQRIGPGAYTVVFNREVTGCAAIVDSDGTQFAHATRITNRDSLLVLLRTSEGAGVDDRFDMLVFCPK